MHIYYHSLYVPLLTARWFVSLFSEKITEKEIEIQHLVPRQVSNPKPHSRKRRRTLAFIKDTKRRKQLHQNLRDKLEGNITFKKGERYLCVHMYVAIMLPPSFPPSLYCPPSLEFIHVGLTTQVPFDKPTGYWLVDLGLYQADEKCPSDGKWLTDIHVYVIKYIDNVVPTQRH